MSTREESARKTRRRQRHPECWACGRLAPKPSHNASAGWQTRETIIDGTIMRECYCPDCFRKWGWPESAGPIW